MDAGDTPSEYPHRQVVFTIPRMLRIFFKSNRKLLGELCPSALRSLIRYFEVVAGRELVPGVIAATQTFRTKINFHPSPSGSQRRSSGPSPGGLLS